VAFVGGRNPSQSASDIPPLSIRIFIEILIDTKRCVSLCAVAFFAFDIITPIRHLLMSCENGMANCPGNGTALENSRNTDVVISGTVHSIAMCDAQYKSGRNGSQSTAP